jgi:hypothetical protein
VRRWIGHSRFCRREFTFHKFIICTMLMHLQHDIFLRRDAAAGV